MADLVRVAKTLRTEHDFRGYIHLKTIPGASELLIGEAGLYADRLSMNVELPSDASLAAYAPEKSATKIKQGLAATRTRIDSAADAGKRAPGIIGRAKPLKFAPAGQSTQMIVGADSASDLAILGGKYGALCFIWLKAGVLRRFQSDRASIQPPAAGGDTAYPRASSLPGGLVTALLRLCAARHRGGRTGGDARSSYRSQACVGAQTSRRFSGGRQYGGARTAAAGAGLGHARGGSHHRLAMHRRPTARGRRTACRVRSRARGHSLSQPTGSPNAPSTMPACARSSCLRQCSFHCSAEARRCTPRRFRRDADEDAFRAMARQMSGRRGNAAAGRLRRPPRGIAATACPWWRSGAPSPFTVPRAFSDLMQDAICHRAPDRFALIYEVLWRIIAWRARSRLARC